MSGTDFDGPPPEGWIIEKSKSTGLPYFFNPVTGVSTYTRPPPTNNITNTSNHPSHFSSTSSTVSTSTTSSLPLPPGWITQTSSKTGKIFYFNTQTGASTYEYPGSSSTATVANSIISSTNTDTTTIESTTNEISNPSKRFRPDPSSSSLPYSNINTSVPTLPPFIPSSSTSTISLSSSSTTTTSSSMDKTIALKVANAYDHLQDRGREGRQSSDILHLKNFNNWIKATLVQAFASKPCLRVLDLACGKLGDLLKWKNNGVQYYCGIDISRQAVEDASVRFNDVARTSSIKAKIIRADLGIIDLNQANIFQSDEQFDAISIQFALHYLFQTEARILNFFRNIAGRLAPGGIFIGTIPDAAVLLRRLRDLEEEETAFGNSIYSIEFTKSAKQAQYALSNHPYGVKYNFYLAESVDHVDEYLVPYELLERLAQSIGLIPLQKDNFHNWFQRLTNPHHNIHHDGLLNITNQDAMALLKRMNVLDIEGTITPEEWEVAGLYRVFAFRAPYPGESVPASSISITNNTVFNNTSTNVAPANIAPKGYDYKSHIEISDIVDLIG